MSEANTVLALKNAWNGAVAASDEVRAAAPTVSGLPEGTSLAELDLDTYDRLTFAQANAVMALRGLVEELRRRRESA